MTPKTMKKQRNIEKGRKDIKYLPTFPTVSKLNGDPDPDNATFIEIKISS